MEKQIVEKVTHLEAQLHRLNSFEFGVRNTKAIAQFYMEKINYYKSLASPTVFDLPLFSAS